jgi:peptidoglycan hydrolase-like protein with peptidoglycan-binding domain
VVAVVSGGAWWFAQGGLGAAAATGSAAPDGSTATTSTASVERRTLTVTEDLSGTLGYSSEYAVLGGLAGTLTWLVAEGTIVSEGEQLYEVDGARRASLMYGSRPAWRDLEAGVSNGADVRQLETNLRDLGFTRKGDTIDRHWDSDTTAAVKRWQKANGLTADGVLELGEIVFLPEAIRITEAAAKLGAGVGPGATIASATSTRQVVSVDLDADDRDLFDVGSKVSIELPDGSTTDGTVASIGTVAETSSDQQGGTSTTLPVTITLDDPAAGAGLDAAPVDVTVIRSSRDNVFAVPVSALLALLEGGYAVEVVDGDGTTTPGASPSSSPAGTVANAAPSTHLVRVEPGLFDNGYVEITADGIDAGDTVVVPS